MNEHPQDDTLNVTIDASQSAGNRAERRALARQLGINHSDMIARVSEKRSDIKHGICKGPRCGKRTILWRPADLCEKCLLGTAVELGELSNAEAVQKGSAR